jgi:hypothetical protein
MKGAVISPDRFSESMVEWECDYGD